MYESVDVPVVVAVTVAVGDTDWERVATIVFECVPEPVDVLDIEGDPVIVVVPIGV